MRKIFFFVMMQIVVLFAVAQNHNQMLLKEYAKELNSFYSLVSTDEMKMAASYNMKNLVISVTYTEKLPKVWMDEGIYRTSIKLMLVSNSGTMGDVIDIMPLLAVLEEENGGIEYRFNFSRISKTVVVSPGEVLNIMTKNFKESEKREFVDWFAKSMEYGGEVVNAKCRLFYDERTKTLEVEYLNEKWSNLTISFYEFSLMVSDLQKELSDNFEEMALGNGREMMGFFYDCGVHAVSISYSNGNQSATSEFSLLANPVGDGERVYNL